MPTRKHDPSPLQQFISNAIDERGMTRYELAVACGWEPRSIYRRLVRPTLTESVERMLAALGATVEIEGHKIRLGLTASGRIRSTRRRAEDRHDHDRRGR